jgi:transcriptional regulator with PAS, ATPase and Fis domain
MLRRNRFMLSSSMLAVLLSVSLAIPAIADNPKRVGQQLSSFKATASQMKSEADLLKSYTPSKRLSWQTHTSQLVALREQLNQLGKDLAVLESHKPVATENQVMAIEHARPHLESIAENLTRALTLVDEDRRNVYSTEYVDAVDSVYAHADELHSKVDAILDYEASKTRLDKLELPDLSGQGS